MVREALVQAYESKMPMVQEGLQDIQHAGHLSEDEDSSALCLQLVQQDRQRLQLTYTTLTRYILNSNQKLMDFTYTMNAELTLY